ncbi:diguanylate cyclase domain-containing protein [Paenibacillus sp. N3.4]|uniref:diguanylate cyclase domain-containing protein n=1 Tax=Paenibacillus sp. N3.4 TaxID=2603222 RepID=UPI00164FE0A9|nr:diguanylate cyclase [Paenibacillus sp. N3.4]
MSHKADSDRFELPWLQKDTFVRQFIEQAWDLFCIFDLRGNLLHASSSFNQMVGFIPNDFEQIIDFIDSEYRMDVHRLFLKTLQTSSCRKLEFRARPINGGPIWLECKTIPIRNEAGVLAEVSFVLSDITLRKKQEGQLIAMAFHDSLTGLPNRRLFREDMQQMLTQARRTGRSFALLYLDIDDFKVINDTMGHEIGDAFLQMFSIRIQDCLREIDRFARMGGDEFTILLPAVDCEEHVDRIAQRIVQCMSDPWDVRGRSFRATVSMGITMYGDEKDEAKMMNEVDIALYQVKGKGRNHYQFYDSAMNGF